MSPHVTYRPDSAEFLLDYPPKNTGKLAQYIGPLDKLRVDRFDRWLRCEDLPDTISKLSESLQSETAA
jgi:hypothetical protein